MSEAEFKFNYSEIRVHVTMFINLCLCLCLSILLLSKQTISNPKIPLFEQLGFAMQIDVLSLLRTENILVDWKKKIKRPTNKI